MKLDTPKKPNKLKKKRQVHKKNTPICTQQKV